MATVAYIDDAKRVIAPGSRSGGIFEPFRRVGPFQLHKRA